MPDKQVVAAVILLCFALGIGVGWTFNGWRKDAVKAQSDFTHARKLEEIALKNIELKERATKAERQLTDQADQSAKKLAEVKVNVQAAFDHRIERIRRGDFRLSVPTRGCVAIANSNSATAAADTQTRSELDTAAAERILAIGKDGDDAIIELNVCIDRYNGARDLLQKFLTQSH